MGKRLPWKGTVNCTVHESGMPKPCGLPAIGVWTLYEHHDSYFCKGHAILLIIGGSTFEPAHLPEPDPNDPLPVLEEANEDTPNEAH